MNEFLKQHKTKIAGYATALVGAVQMGLPALGAVLSPATLGILTFCMGLIVALIGHYNTSQGR
jgi:hypothetical protein